MRSTLDSTLAWWIARPILGLPSVVPAAEVRLSQDVLDRIDEIVPPGVTVNPADNGWTAPAVARCEEFAARVAGGESSALVPTCASLRASIDKAVTDGRVEVLPP